MGWVVRSMLRYWRQTIQVFGYLAGRENPEWTEITVEELHEKMESTPPALLIDVRSREEFSGKYGHLPTARWIPLLELESIIPDLNEFKEKEIVTMCPGGGLSLVAVDLLKEAGFTDVKSLKGGTDEWYQKGYQTVLD